MITLSGDPLEIPFNTWLKNNGMYVAIGVAAVLIIVIVTLLIINKKQKK